MNRRIKFFGPIAAAAAALVGIGILGAGESAPAYASPAIGAAAAAPVATSVAQPVAVATPDCAKQAWPYVARECLAAADGTPVRKVTRTITTSAR